MPGMVGPSTVIARRTWIQSNVRASKTFRERIMRRGNKGGRDGKKSQRPKVSFKLFYARERESRLFLCFAHMQRARGHRQKGSGTVMVSRGSISTHGVTMAEWQKTPKQACISLIADNIFTKKYIDNIFTGKMYHHKKYIAFLPAFASILPVEQTPQTNLPRCWEPSGRQRDGR